MTKPPLLLLLLLFLFLLLLVSEWGEVEARNTAFSPVLLPVYQKTFVKVFSGVPGKHITLRIHKQCNDTITLFSVPTSYSKSYTQYDASHGSEIFLLGQHALRLPVLYNNNFLLEEQQHDGFAHSYNIQYEGLLCLGPHSRLWNYWSRYSCSTTDLLLGEHDHHLDRLSYQPFSDYVGHGSSVFCPQVNQTYSLEYEPESTMTYLPEDLYFYARDHHEHIILRLENGAYFTLTHHDFSSRFPQYNFDYATVRRSSGNHIVLGKQPMGKFVWHGDASKGKHQLCLSYELFDIGNAQPSFNGVTAFLLTIALCFWFAITYTENINEDERTSRALLFLEAFVYFACVLCLVAEHEGFAVQRYLDRHVGSTHYYYPLLLFIGANIILGVATSFVYGKTPSQLSFRKSAVESALILTLWVTQLDNRYSGIEQAFLMLIAAIYTWSRSIAFLWHLTELDWAKRWPRTLSLGVYALVSHLFLLMYNIDPIVSRFWHGFPHHWSNVLFFWHAFSLLPAIHTFIHFVLADIKNDLSEPPPPTVAQ